MDEPTRSTQPSLIMAPPGLEADPDGEAADAVVNNGTMSPSRTRAGSSRSAASQRDAGAIEDAPADDAAPAAKEATDTTSGTTAPLPADTIGKAKAKARWLRHGDGEAADQAALTRPRARRDRGAGDVSGQEQPDAVVHAVGVRCQRPLRPLRPGLAASTASPARRRQADRGALCLPSAGTSYAPPASYPRPDESAADASTGAGAAWQRLRPGRPTGHPTVPRRPLPARRRAWRARWPPRGSGAVRTASRPGRAAPRYASRPSGRRCSRSRGWSPGRS